MMSNGSEAVASPPDNSFQLANVFTPRVRLFAAIAAGIFVVDQWTKWLAISHLTNAFAADGATSFGEKLSSFLWTKHPLREEAVAVIDGFWHFRYVENPGAAFGFLSGSGSSLRTPFFLAVSLGAMIFIITYFRKTEAGQGLLRVALALVFGGAIGNFVDRIRLGYVIDFIDWHWYETARWPTFNVADSAITVGVGLLLLEVFMNPAASEGSQSKEKSKEKSKAKKAS